MTKFKFGNVVLCEHAVQGAHNKPTLVGVYSGDIIVQTLPANLSFGLLVEIENAPSPGNLELEFFLDHNSFAKVSATLPPNKEGNGLVIIPMIQAGIPKDLDFEIRASLAGRKPERILKKRIFQGAIPQP